MSSGELQLPGGENIALDERGYLLDPNDWSPPVAEAMATADGINLLEDHWVILEIFREYYNSYEIEPPMRALVQRARERLGEEKGSSRYLYRLFPDGPEPRPADTQGSPVRLAASDRFS